MAKKTIKAEEEKTSKVVSIDPDVRVEVAFSRTIQVNDEWAKAGVKITRNIEDLESSEDEFEKLWDKAENQVSSFLEKDEDSDDEDEDASDDDDDSDEDEDDSDDDDSDEDEDDEDDEDEDEDDEDEDDSDEDEDDSDDDDSDEDEDDEDDEDEDEDDEDDEDEISEDEINAMSKKELKELCKNTEGLEKIDTSAKLKPLRKAVLEALFEDSDWENTEWDD